jgi:2-phosphosulfolactate phosphatase
VPGEIKDLKIVQAGGVEGARRAGGTVVVIDVLRAFTVSAYALAGGASACRLVREVDEARALAASLDGALVSAEIDGLPVEGIPISNSPTQIEEADLRGRVLVQRSSAGTQAAAAASGADRLLAASLVVAGATARAILVERPERVTIVASRPDHEEDTACAAYVEAMLRGRRPPLDDLLAPLKRGARYQRLASGTWPGFPVTDLSLALVADRFDFAMPVERDELGLVVRRLPS